MGTLCDLMPLPIAQVKFDRATKGLENKKK